MSCAVGHRHNSDPTLLWPWCRLAAATPIRPLAWELPYAADAALKKLKKKKFNLTSNQDRQLKTINIGVPLVAQQIKNLTLSL